jgi:hypothetical protein
MFQNGQLSDVRWTMSSKCRSRDKAESVLMKAFIYLNQCHYTIYLLKKVTTQITAVIIQIMQPEVPSLHVPTTLKPVSNVHEMTVYAAV